jgi:hypothetical protein
MIEKKILNRWNDKKSHKSRKIRISSESRVFERKKMSKIYSVLGLGPGS